jgi:hypothetical protein
LAEQKSLVHARLSLQLTGVNWHAPFTQASVVQPLLSLHTTLVRTHCPLTQLSVVQALLSLHCAAVVQQVELFPKHTPQLSLSELAMCPVVPPEHTPQPSRNAVPLMVPLQSRAGVAVQAAGVPPLGLITVKLMVINVPAVPVPPAPVYGTTFRV